MKTHWKLALGAAAGTLVMVLPKAVGPANAAAESPAHGASTQPGEALGHTRVRFEFAANGPLESVAPLFGADKERVWAPQWDPKFVYPLPAADMQGMVFTVAHGHRDSVWVNTQLDLKNGRVQYVYVIPDRLVTLITLRLTSQGQQTHVAVEYERTALSPQINDHVRQMAEQDARSGPVWEEQINSYLNRKS